ncbi:MAG: hypothetical protein GWP91_17425 [Rhodobacterales bacterium]|nr:hypothetical protein [Rhodobacterales bacterium]
MAILISNVLWPGEGLDPTSEIASRLGVKPTTVVAVKLLKKSLDGRHLKQRWQAVYRVEVSDEAAVLANPPHGVRAWTARDDGRYGVVQQGPQRHIYSSLPVIVIGAGPAGLFGALWLVESGVPVVLIERGGPVEDRIPAVNGFWRGKSVLDSENNLLFGEGGAGTFSDGKIYTRRRDGELGFIFQRLKDFGADPDALTDALAHLGTDKIRAILPPFRARLKELGCEIRFHCRVDEILVEDGATVGVKLGNGEVLRAEAVIAATGHSARDAIQMLVDAGAAAEPRGIAVGARIEHPQRVVDQGRYGKKQSDVLPPASYRLAHTPRDGRSAHTFCMCPGGMVVPASNHPERVVVNGMSFAARRAMWANSAVIVAVHPSDYGATDPMAGFRWQDRIEKLAYDLAGGDYRAPAQRVQDLFRGQASTEIGRTSFPMGVTPMDLREILPEPLIVGMKAGIAAFERKLPGFSGEEAVLIAPETRTTSPIRFLRDERQCSTTVRGLYPTGEGAGYAGGIISSALDGMRAARFIVKTLD